MTQTVEFNPVPFIAKEMQLPGSSVEAVVDLLRDGNTVPFSDDIHKRFYVITSANRELHEKILNIVADIKKTTGLEWKKLPK